MVSLQKLEQFCYYSLILLLPVQLGKHFWPEFSFVSGFRIDYLSPTLYITDIIIGALFCLWIINNYKKIFRSSHRLVFVAHPLSLFLLYVSITLFFVQTPLLSLYGFFKLIEMGFVGYYTAQFFTPKRLKTIAILFSCCVFFESSLAIAQFVNQGSLGGFLYLFGERTFTGQTPGIANISLSGSLMLRPYATFPHPNVLAGFLVISMIFILSVVRRERSRLRQILFFCSLIIGSIALLITLSRLAIVVWCVLLISYAFSDYKYKKITLLGIGVLFVMFALSPLKNRFFETSILQESVVARFDLMSASFLMIQDHFLFGVGLFHFLPALPSYISSHTLSLLQPVHNVFFLFTSELGIIGLCFLLYFLFKTRQRLKVHAHWLSFSLFITAVSLGLIDHYFLTIQQGQLLTAILFGCIWSKKLA